MCGAAKIIKNDELNAESLHSTIEEMLSNNNLEEMGNLARKVSIKDTSDKIYGEIQKLLKENK